MSTTLFCILARTLTYAPAQNGGGGPPPADPDDSMEDQHQDTPTLPDPKQPVKPTPTGPGHGE
jgi:hypothetical protein